MSDLAERVARVQLLLTTLNDPYPTPRGHLQPDSGPAPSAYVPCETCKATGEVKIRGRYSLCLLCDGDGWKRRDGAPAWDAYLNLPLDEAAQLPQANDARPSAEDDEYAFAWQRQRARYDAKGSYAELRRQLDWLALTAPRRYWLVRSVHVEQQTRVLSPVDELALQLGVLAIARRMRRVRVPGWLIERTQAEERRSSLDQLAEQGFGAGEIARTLGMSKRAVVRKLKRQTVESKRAGVPVTAT